MLRVLLMLRTGRSLAEKAGCRTESMKKAVRCPTCFVHACKHLQAQEQRSATACPCLSCHLCWGQSTAAAACTGPGEGAHTLAHTRHTPCQWCHSLTLQQCTAVTGCSSNSTSSSSSSSLGWCTPSAAAAAPMGTRHHRACMRLMPHRAQSTASTAVPPASRQQQVCRAAAPAAWHSCSTHSSGCVGCQGLGMRRAGPWIKTLLAHKTWVR